MNQRWFEFRDAAARSSDPSTSHEAAASVEGEEASHMERMVMDVLSTHPKGLTNHDLVELTGVAWNSISPRIKPLTRKGYVVNSGEKRKGPTNRYCIVWKLADKQ